jgi:hypothetical protein
LASLRERAQIPWHDAAGAAVEHLDDTTTVQTGYDRRELVPASTVSLIQRQSPRRPSHATCQQLLAAGQARSRHLIARG